MIPTSRIVAPKLRQGGFSLLYKPKIRRVRVFYDHIVNEIVSVRCRKCAQYIHESDFATFQVFLVT